MEYKYDRSRHFDIPKFFYFEAKNSTVGGRNTFNYKIDPIEVQVSEDKKEKRFRSIVWYGALCSELAEIAAEKEFAFDEDGYKGMIYWIDEEYDKYAAKVASGEIESRRTFNGEL